MSLIRVASGTFNAPPIQFGYDRASPRIQRRKCTLAYSARCKLLAVNSPGGPERTTAAISAFHAVSTLQLSYE